MTGLRAATRRQQAVRQRGRAAAGRAAAGCGSRPCGCWVRWARCWLHQAAQQPPPTWPSKRPNRWRRLRVAARELLGRAQRRADELEAATDAPWTLYSARPDTWADLGRCGLRPWIEPILVTIRVLVNTTCTRLRRGGGGSAAVSLPTVTTQYIRQQKGNMIVTKCGLGLRSWRFAGWRCD